MADDHGNGRIRRGRTKLKESFDVPDEGTRLYGRLISTA